MAISWTVHNEQRDPAPDEVVPPDGRLPWPHTIGLGIQQALIMGGLTAILPVFMGFNPSLALMLSAVATVLLLLVTSGRMPVLVGSSILFFAAVGTIRQEGGQSVDLVTNPGALDGQILGGFLVVGLVVLLFGLLMQLAGPAIVSAILPPAVSGALVVMAAVASVVTLSFLNAFWTPNSVVALSTTGVVLLCMVIPVGLISRLSVVIGLAFGFLLSWGLDHWPGPLQIEGGPTGMSEQERLDWNVMNSLPWFSLPESFTLPNGGHVSGITSPADLEFKSAVLLTMLPIALALLAESAGHMKAAAIHARVDGDEQLGAGVAVIGGATSLAALVGGTPVTPRPESVGTNAASRSASSLPIYLAAGLLFVLGFFPKVGAFIAATPRAVLGGVALALFASVVMLGVRIWTENRVNFSNPINLFSVGLGVLVTLATLDINLNVHEDFNLLGLGLGMLVTILAYHLMRALAPESWRATVDGVAAFPPGEELDDDTDEEADEAADAVEAPAAETAAAPADTGAPSAEMPADEAPAADEDGSDEPGGTGKA